MVSPLGNDNMKPLETNQNAKRVAQDNRTNFGTAKSAGATGFERQAASLDSVTVHSGNDQKSAWATIKSWFDSSLSRIPSVPSPIPNTSWESSVLNSAGSCAPG